MGAGMAHNFLKAGHTVTVWNRSLDRTLPLSGAGALVAETPAEATAQADIVIEVVADDEASRAVWLDPDAGILSQATGGKTLITAASLSISWTTELAAICAERGFKFLDMPLTGSRAGAEGGALQLLVGGDESVLNSIRPTLAAIAKKIHYFGPSPNGMKFKLILNAIQAAHNLAAVEAMQLAESVGLDKSAVASALLDMGPASPLTRMVFDRMSSQSDQVNFAIQWIAKDLRYASEMATEAGLDLPILNDVTWAFDQADSFEEVCELDWMEIYQFLDYERDDREVEF